MTPEQEQALHDHVQAIAEILYEATPPEQLTKGYDYMNSLLVLVFGTMSS